MNEPQKITGFSVNRWPRLRLVAWLLRNWIVARLSGHKLVISPEVKGALKEDLTKWNR